MSTITPRHVLCVLGQWEDLDDVDAIIQKDGGGFELDWDYSTLVPDKRMKGAFEASYDRVSPTMTEADWRAIAAHESVVYVLSPPVPREKAADISGRALLLTEALLRGGGVAAKSESAGIAHGRDRWLKLAAEYREAADGANPHAQGSSLFWAWVRRPLVDPQAAVFYTCGMHLLGERDIEIESSLDVSTALEWLDLLGLYLAADRPQRPLKDGEGFRLKDAGPRRVMRLGPCKRYDAEGFLFNPYGYIRLESEGLPE